MKSSARPFFRLLSALALTLCAAACFRAISTVDFPTIVSGEVRVVDKSGVPDERFLSFEEVSALSAWLQSHREGWHYSAEAPPPARAFIVLHAANGSRLSLKIFRRCLRCQEWDRALMLSSDNELDGAVRQFSSPDFEFIQSLMRH